MAGKKKADTVVSDVVVSGQGDAAVSALKAYEAQDYDSAVILYAELGDAKTAIEWNNYAYSIWRSAQVKWRAAIKKANELDPYSDKIKRNYFALYAK
jgi:hypothetical protein